jgi:hypothetical protein
MIKNTKILWVIILLISCSRNEEIMNDQFDHSFLVFSDQYEYGISFNHKYIVDSLRIDKFSIYKILDHEREFLLYTDTVWDSVLVYDISLVDNPEIAAFLDSAYVVDLDKQGILLREFFITYSRNDHFFNTHFTEESFEWDIENMKLTYLSTGITIQF